MPVYLKTRANLGKKRKSRNANSIGIFGLFDRSTKFRKSAFLRTGLRFLVTRRVHFCTFSRPALSVVLLTKEGCPPAVSYARRRTAPNKMRTDPIDRVRFSDFA